MLRLDKSLFIAKGLDRECYQHPHDDTKCIKVTFSGDHKQSTDELKYHRRMQRMGIDFTHVSRLQGVVETNLGSGLVFDLVRDHSGHIAKPLRYYLKGLRDGSLSIGNRVPDYPLISQQLFQLGAYIRQQGIIMRDLKDDNLLWCWNSGSKGVLIIIDGFGNNELIPLSDFIVSLKRRKMNRKWGKFYNKLISQFPLLDQKES